MNEESETNIHYIENAVRDIKIGSSAAGSYCYDSIGPSGESAPGDYVN